jgi:hypothetical protein
MINYYSTSLWLLMWSVLPSSSNGKRKATHTRSSDPSTSSARCYQNPRLGTHRCRSYSTRSWSPRRSYDTISRSHRSPSWSSTCLAIYSTTGDTTRRISKWAIELGDLTIYFKPHTSIKSQALVTQGHRHGQSGGRINYPH